MTEKRLVSIFYKTDSGKVPVLEWIKELDSSDRKIIGDDLRTIEEGYPIGMPVCRPLKDGLLECRSTISNSREVRIIFCIDDGKMYILHGFIKKTQQTNQDDIKLALKRKRGMGL